MKKLWTILVLCLVCAFCAIGFAACDDKTEPEPAPAPAPASVAMTKDEFLAELIKRETATFADTSLHYATVDCKLVLSEGDAESDGTYEQTCDITYVTNPSDGNVVYTSVKIGTSSYHQHKVLYFSTYFNSIFEYYVPAELLAAFKFEKSGDNLKLLCDSEYTVEETTVKVYMEYEFDVNGYLKYRKESTGDGTNGESIEFTAKVYNRTKDLEVDAFLNTLRELEHLSYEDVRYASVSGTTVEKEGANPETTETKDFKLEYRIDDEDHEVAHTEGGLTVLGLSWLMEEYVEHVSGGEYTVKKVGSNYDVVATFDSVQISIHFIFDKDGYIVYYLEQEGDAYRVEFTATAYNKTSGETVDYTVNSEQWDAAVSLYWTNVTYEFTSVGYGTQKVELLEDGGLHQYAKDDGWGEVFVIYSEAKWKVYQSENHTSTPDFEYDTEADYIDGSYGDDVGFMGAILPSISGKFDEFTFDSANNQYVADNIGIPMGGPDNLYPMTVTAKFENQKLVYLKIYSADVGVTAFEATFTDYGTTVIEYPDYILNA